MQYLDNTKILCLTPDELIPDIISTEENLRQMKSRGKAVVHGVGGNERVRLVEYESLPEKYKTKIKVKYGNPYEYFAKQPLLALLQRDMEARAFYAGYILESGAHLPEQYQRRYSRQCDWLNMINIVLGDKKALKEELRISVATFYEHVLSLIKNDDEDNGLPSSERRLKERMRVYKDNGYEGLISNHFGNQKTRKVDKDIERLLLALYLQPEKPYIKGVCEAYRQFIQGEITVVDVTTGECFEPKDFFVDGKPYEVKESTVRYYIEEKPLNRALVDKHRTSQLAYVTKHRPHHKRKAPEYALSKITMDDITVPFKMPDGKRVWSYQIFDVASQAVIGVAFAKDKNKDLVKESLRDMFRNIMRHGMGMPLEVEVEQHLNSSMKGKTNDAGEFVADVMTEGALFPFVRFCAPGNPQEKRAEGFIKQKKYGHQNKRVGFLRRPFARLEANRANEDDKDMRFTYETVVRNEREDIDNYNNKLHPNQEKYAGMTRWEVLEQTQNPGLQRANLINVLPYVGHKVNTSIRRGYVQIMGNHYMLEDVHILERLSGNKLTAYYLNDDSGAVWYAHLYDTHDNPLCEAVEVQAYQEAQAERTDEDERIINEQRKYIAAFDAVVKKMGGELRRVGIVATTQEDEEITVELVETAPKVQQKPTKVEGFEQDDMKKQDWIDDEEMAAMRATRDI